MAKNRQSPLVKDLFVNELLDVLDAHKSTAAADLRNMLTNVTNMENQLAAANREIAMMRQELNTIREDSHPMRKTLQNATNSMQRQIDALREQLDTLKQSIIDGCKNVLNTFKERGITALNNISEFFNLRPVLEKMAVTLEKAEQRDTSIISKIETMSTEYHKTGQHLQNIGRAITGKEPLLDPKPVGKVAKAMEAPFKAARACCAATWFSVQGALENLSKLEKAAKRHSPIKEQYDNAAGEAAKHNAAHNKKDRAKPAPAVEL